MTTRMKRMLHEERGATLAEYALATAILLPVFLAASVLLHVAARERAIESASTVRNMTPHGSRVLDLAGGSPDPSVQDDADPEMATAMEVRQ